MSVILGLDLSSTAAGVAWLDLDTGALVGKREIRPRGEVEAVAS